MRGPSHSNRVCLFIISVVSTLAIQLSASAKVRDYYYTRTRDNPRHLRISEQLKNRFVGDVKLESRINGTKFEYYRSRQAMNYDELVFETIDKMFQHRLSPFYIHHYDSDEDKRRSSDPRLVSQEACARDLLYLVDKMPLGPQRAAANQLSEEQDDRDHLTPELAAFFDSYARQEAGLLMGNTFWVGAYDQCVSRHVFELIDSASRHRKAEGSTSPTGEDDNSQQAISFKGRYCVASLRAPAWERIIERSKAQNKDYFRTERELRDYSKLFRLQVGICLPDSCDSTALERHHDEIKLLTNSMLTDSRLQDYNLIDLYCLPDETSPLRQWSSSAVNFLIFVGLWLTLVLLATLADLFDLFPSQQAGAGCDGGPEKSAPELGDGRRRRAPNSSSKLTLFVGWFSLRANNRKLLHVGGQDASAETQTPAAKTPPLASCAPQQQDGRKHAQQQHQEPQPLKIDLRFLNAFKVAVMFWILNGHIMLLMIQTAKNILNSDALLNGLMHFLIGATFGVDLFFTMTGFLTAYLMFNSGHAYKMRVSTWVYLSFHRYWRLAPMYLLSFWFSRSVAQMLGSGPLWDYGTSSNTFRGLCNTESWWFPLTLTSNWHGLFDECMITSWYISCDMQFWLVSPLFIYLLAKSPASGWLVSLATIVASSQLRYQAVLDEKAARYDELVRPRADIFMRVSHDMPALYTQSHYRISAYIVGLLAGHYVYMLKSHKWTSVLTQDLVQEQRAAAEPSAHDYQAGAQARGQRQGRDSQVVRDSAAAADSSASIIGHERSASDHDDADDDKRAIGAPTRDKGPKQVGDDKAEAKQRRQDSQRMATGAGGDAGTLNSSASDHGKLGDDVTRAKSKQQRACSRAQLSRRLRGALAYAGLAIFLTMAFASYLLSHHFPISMLRHAKPVAAALYALDHLIMSSAASLVIVCMCLGQWPGLNRWLSHPNWTRLSKINYALLLLQCEAIYYQIFRYEQVPVAGTRELVNILFNVLVTLYPVAFLVTLVFEFPLANVEKLLLGGV